MSYEELADFIANTMSMSHIYQPLLIRTLVESGGLAPLRQLRIRRAGDALMAARQDGSGKPESRLTARPNAGRTFPRCARDTRPMCASTSKFGRCPGSECLGV